MYLLSTVMVTLGKSLSQKTNIARNSWNIHNTIDKTNVGLAEMRQKKKKVKNYDSWTKRAANRAKGQINREDKRKQNGRYRRKLNQNLNLLEIILEKYRRFILSLNRRALPYFTGGVYLTWFGNNQIWGPGDNASSQQ